MIARILIGFALLAADAAAASGPRLPACRARPELVGACRTVHGRLFAANGTPSLRIWIVGTRRILGVTDWRPGSGEDPILPANVRAALGDRPFDVQVYGDFEVCPFTRERPGWMQFVCVVSGRRLVVRRL